MSAIGIIGILILGGLIVLVFTLAVCKSASDADDESERAQLEQMKKEMR